MKTSIILSSAVVIFSVLIIGCEKEKTKKTDLNVQGRVLSISDCKNNKSAGELNETPKNSSCIEYSFDQNNNKLSLQHINSGFNCCPDSVYCIVNFNNDTIIVQEYESQSGCQCDCLYDLEIEINGIESKEYFVKIIEPYSGEQDKLYFDIDLSANISGSYCVTRNGYPWGLY
jgi:hypothetical protein